MDGVGGKRRGGGFSVEEQEHLQVSRDISGASAKKPSARRTPTWIPHASANRPRSQSGAGRSNKNDVGAERLQSISDSQRKFAAQYSRSAAPRGLKLSGDARGSGVGSRWASRPERPQDNVGVPLAPDKSRFEEAKFRAAGVRNRAPIHGAEKGERIGRVQGGEDVRGGDGGGGRDDESELYRGRAPIPGKTGNGAVKGPWTKEEDQKIIDCITQNITKWSEIAEHVEGRVGKQCRERWFNHLDPSLKKSSWTPAEDDILVSGQARYGNSWTKIAKLLPGRSENAVKNRWNSAARKKGKADPRNPVPSVMGSGHPQLHVGVSASRVLSQGYLCYQQVSMMPESPPIGQVSHVMMPSLQAEAQMKSSGWPASLLDKQGHMGTMIHGSRFQSMQHPLQAQPTHQGIGAHCLSNDTAFLATDGFLGNSMGPLAIGQQGYEQPTMPQQRVSVAQRMPVRMGLQRHPVAASARFAAQPTTDSAGVTTIFSDPRAESLEKRESAAAMSPAPNEQHAVAESKSENPFTEEDELSLSATLFNISLDQASMGSFRADFSGKLEPGKNGTEHVGAGVARTGGSADAGGVVTSLDHAGQFCNGSAAPRAGLNGAITNSLLRGQGQMRMEEACRQSRAGISTSVTDLLFSPAELAMGVCLPLPR